MAAEIISKRCTGCKQNKSLLEFYRNRTTKDGYHYQCKTCRLQLQCKYRQTKNGKTTQKKYNQSQKGKLAYKHYQQSEKGKANQKKYSKTEKGKITRSKGAKKFYIYHPEQIKAKDAVNHAIIAGKLPRPDTLQCHYCPAQAEQYHHFLGYAPEYWFDVIPICIPCHHNYAVLASSHEALPASLENCSR